MSKKTMTSTAMGRQRALENKSWEANILQQIIITKEWEEDSFRRELELQTLTQEAKRQELLLLLNILDLKVNSEVTQARAYEAKVHESTCEYGVSGRRSRYLLRLRKTWYLNKAQEHRNRAQQLITALGELEILFLQCSASLRQIRQQKFELIKQQEPKSKLNITPSSVSQSTCMSDMKRLALHNNLLVHLDWQKLRTAQQEASTALQIHLFSKQREIVSNLQEYYKDLKHKYEM